MEHEAFSNSGKPKSEACIHSKEEKGPTLTHHQSPCHAAGGACQHPRRHGAASHRGLERTARDDLRPAAKPLSGSQPALPSSRKDALAWPNCPSLEVYKPQQGRHLLEAGQKDPCH